MGNLRAISEHPFYKFSDFRKLYLGRFISGLGDKVAVISLAWWLLTKDQGNNQLQLGIMMALTFIPVVLFGPFFGPLVDRLNRKTCMIVADGLRCLLYAGLGAAFVMDYTPLALVYPCCFFASAFIPLFESASSSSLVQLTGEEHLASASAFDASVVELSGIAGALCVSALFVQLGQGGIFLFNAATFLISLILIAGIRTNLRPSPQSDPQRGGSESYGAQLRSGFTYIVRTKAILGLLTLFALLNVFVSPILIFIPLIVQESLHQDMSWVAALEVAMSAGSLIAFIAFSMVKRVHHVYRLFFVVIASMSVCLIGTGILHELTPLMTGIFLFGGCLAVVNGLSMMLFQLGVPDDMKGRFFAILKTVCFAVIPLTFVWNGYLAESWSLTGTVIANGIASLLLSVLILFIPRVTNEIE